MDFMPRQLASAAADSSCCRVPKQTLPLPALTMVLLMPHFLVSAVQRGVSGYRRSLRRRNDTAQPGAHLRRLASPPHAAGALREHRRPAVVVAAASDVVAMVGGENHLRLYKMNLSDGTVRVPFPSLGRAKFRPKRANFLPKQPFS